MIDFNPQDGSALWIKKISADLKNAGKLWRFLFPATKTALEMQERTGGYYDRRTLERRIRAIKGKIAAIL